MDKFLNKVIQGDCLEIMKQMPDKSVDLVLTSPPYDNLRSYEGNLSWNFEITAQELYRLVKEGGVVVWVVGDATINGSETGTSFKQALYFKEIGFNLHDTMIYHKGNAMPLNHNRYDPCFEYMFVFSKGVPSIFNPLKDKTLHEGKVKKRELETKMIGVKCHQSRNRDEHTVVKKEKYRKNLWTYMVGVERDRKINKHPAIFPLELCKDHIKSWTNENDTILDPFAGSCTTAIAAKQLNRNFICIEKEPEYIKVCDMRLANFQTTLL